MKEQKTVRKKPQNKALRFLYDLFRTKKLAGIGLCILAFFILVAVFADVLAPYKLHNGVLEASVLDRLKPPSLKHPFGTDSIGRDLFSYMIYGARTSVILAVVCTLLSTILSVVIGVTSAVLGGWFDLVLQRFVDAWQCIPSMLIMLILMSMLGNGMVQMIIVLSIPAGIAGSRMIRSAAISVKDSGYVKMSQMLGGGALWKMVRHVVPNIMPVILMSLAGSIGGVIMMEASMNFLGYGVAANTPDWGAMLTGSGRSNMYLAPWLCIIPGIAIALIVFAAAMFGDGVRDLLDPRLKGGVGSYKTKGKKRRLERSSI